MEAFKKNLDKRFIKEKGFGIFTKVELVRDSIILEFKGKLLSFEDLKSKEDYYLQIATDLCIGPSGDYDDYVNHSCSPNCTVVIVGNRALLKTIKLIPAETEITFDYSTTSTETKDNFIFKCNCKSFNCRKEISGFQYLNDAQKQFCKSMKIIPNYILDKT